MLAVVLLLRLSCLSAVGFHRSGGGKVREMSFKFIHWSHQFWATAVAQNGLRSSAANSAYPDDSDGRPPIYSLNNNVSYPDTPIYSKNVTYTPVQYTNLSHRSRWNKKLVLNVIFFSFCLALCLLCVFFLRPRLQTVSVKMV